MRGGLVHLVPAVSSRIFHDWLTCVYFPSPSGVTYYGSKGLITTLRWPKGDPNNEYDWWVGHALSPLSSLQPSPPSHRCGSLAQQALAAVQPSRS